MPDAMQGMPKTEKEWKDQLTPEQYRVLRMKDTERPGSSSLVDEHGDGVFRCAGCGAELFRSGDKFDSGTGWPSFTAAAAGDRVKLQDDSSFGMKRTEVVCARCGGHLGHLFDEPTPPSGLRGPSSKWTGKRFCINGCALTFNRQ